VIVRHAEFDIGDGRDLTLDGNGAIEGEPLSSDETTCSSSID